MTNGTTARALLETIRDHAPTQADLDALIATLARRRAKTWRTQVSEHAQFSDGAVIGLEVVLARLCAAGDLAGRMEVIFATQEETSGIFTTNAWPMGTVFATIFGAQDTHHVPLLQRFATADDGFDPSGVIPRAVNEAIRDLRTREPRVAARLEEAAQHVRRQYGGYRHPTRHRRVYPHGFALARSLDATVTARVRDAIVSSIQAGDSEDAAVAKVMSVQGVAWTPAYAQVVARTNTTTAFAAGRHQQAEAIERETGRPVYLRFETAEDERVRRGRPEDQGENHLAMHAITARANDQVWEHFSPPLGFNCRCVLVPSFDGSGAQGNALGEARARGARASVGFGRRPDRVTRGG